MDSVLLAWITATCMRGSAIPWVFFDDLAVDLPHDFGQVRKERLSSHRWKLVVFKQQEVIVLNVAIRALLLTEALAHACEAAESVLPLEEEAFLLNLDRHDLVCVNGHDATDLLERAELRIDVLQIYLLVKVLDEGLAARYRDIGHRQIVVSPPPYREHMLPAEVKDVHGLRRAVNVRFNHHVGLVHWSVDVKQEDGFARVTGGAHH